MDVGREMSDTLNYIQQRYGLDFEAKSPIEIPNVGRENLAILFRELGFKSGAEIGVQEGIYSEMLCRANPEMTLYSIDPWRAYEGYRDHSSQAELDGLYEEAVARLSHYNCVIVRKTSMEALGDFEDKSLDFVYVDANHEIPWAIEDIWWAVKKVRSGGIVAGHDYFESTVLDTKMHVKYVVNCAVQCYRIKPWFLLGRKQAPQGEIRDDARSWFWVNR